MATRPQLTGLSLFAGTGMLDEGARAGFDLLGFGYRCVGYVERDAYAAATLVARMESAALDQAPVWDDIATFDGRAWCGAVDCIVAGFPCQDISVAGLRAGLDGSRSGLFYEVLRIAADCGARFLFLENVAGIASATATVVDETEGELLERAAARVVGELADRGWHAEWLHLRASDVGAAHRRERWFCLAWRSEMADAKGGGGGFRKRKEFARGTETESAGTAMEHAECPRRQTSAGRQQHARREPVETSEPVANASQQRRQQIARCASGDEGAHEGRPAQHDNEPVGVGADVDDVARIPIWKRTGRQRIFYIDQKMDNSEGERRRQGRPEHARLEGRRSAAEHGGELGLADSTDREGGGQDYDEEGRENQAGHAGLAGRELFAPGPLDPRWAGIVADTPHLAPAIEPGICRLVDGLAYRVDEYRADRLRCIGNGVVPLQAATALVLLARKMNL